MFIPYVPYISKLKFIQNVLTKSENGTDKKQYPKYEFATFEPCSNVASAYFGLDRCECECLEYLLLLLHLYIHNTHALSSKG
jgi:hypothetical protein